jgi:hypothetical protein
MEEGSSRLLEVFIGRCKDEVFLEFLFNYHILSVFVDLEVVQL